MSTRFQIRTFRRFAIQCHIYNYKHKVHGKGTAWNQSLNGWRVDGTHPVEPGMAFTLCIFLPGRIRTVFVDRAAVRWSRGHEFGIELVAMKNEQQVVLKDFVDLLIRPAPIDGLPLA